MTGRRALITDLDNTLWDWVEIWHASFRALVEGVADRSGWEMDALLTACKAVHQKHRTSEVSTLLQEIPDLTPAGKDPREYFAEAIRASRKARKLATRLYPGVRSTLEAFKEAGWLVVGYTESLEFWSRFRLKRAEIDHLFEYLYSGEDHSMPEGIEADELRTLPPAEYQLPNTRQRHTPRGVVKPSPEILLGILNEVGVQPSDSFYVGDNLWKDVRMAQQAGVPDIWARYGTSHEKPAYELLKKVTHWRDEDVQQEIALRHEDVRPTYVLDDFSQLLGVAGVGA